MKLGYKHNTAIFGTDAEHYLSRLFMMMENPNGTRRPDLVSINGRYNPRLSVEVKSGIEGKTSLVASQLHYAITCEQDYIDLFGDPVSKGFFVDESGNSFGSLDDNPLAYYYAIISREGDVRSDRMNIPHASILLDWKDVALVPHDLVFYSFAVARAIRTGEEPLDVVDDLFKLIKENFDEQSSLYTTRRGTQDWQNFYLRDMVAVFSEDFSIATKAGQTRLELLAEHFPGYSSLKRIEMSGPNGTNVYVLSNPEDVDLFDRQLRDTVKERVPVLEKVSRSRKNARRLLRKIEKVQAGELIGGSATDASKKYSLEKLTPTERRRLRRLELWADRGEPAILKPAYNPCDDGCSEEIEEANASSGSTTDDIPI